MDWFYKQLTQYETYDVQFKQQKEKGKIVGCLYVYCVIQQKIKV